MERLTKYDVFGNADIIGVNGADLQGNLEFNQMNLVTAALRKLARYEDLTEQGRLKILPCNVGDKVYVAVGKMEKRKYVEFAKEGVLDSFIIGANGRLQAWIDLHDETTFCDCDSDFGKIVFLNKEAAEAAIKEREE